MSDTSTLHLTTAAAPTNSLARAIPAALLSASVVYIAAITAFLPRVASVNDATDGFLAAFLPALLVVMVLWAARPAAFPQRRRRTLVAVSALGAAAAAVLPLLFPPA